MTTGRLSYTLQGTQPVTGWLARYAAAFVTAEVLLLAPAIGVRRLASSLVTRMGTS
jgi:hypothetical protein